jgi:hypothetical protein
VWSLSGAIAAIVMAGFAWWRSSQRGFYDGDVYGMTAVTHRRYAIAAGLCAAGFAATYAMRLEALAIALLTLFTLLAVFYGTSFLRGFSDVDDH